MVGFWLLYPYNRWYWRKPHLDMDSFNAFFGRARQGSLKQNFSKGNFQGPIAIGLITYSPRHFYGYDVVL